MSTVAHRAPLAWPLLGGLLVAAASTLSGCGPYLYPRPVSTVAFASTTRCAQGPFELHGRTLGSRWGERIEVYAEGSAIDGHITIEVDGEKKADTPFHTVGHGATPSSGGASVEYTEKPSRAACLLSDRERDRATTVTTTPLPGPLGPVLPSGGPPAPGGEIPQLRMVPIDQGYSAHHTDMASWTFQVTSLSIQPLRAGADIKIVFWSDTPLDLGGVKFFVRQSMEVATDDADWAKKLTDDAEDEARERARRNARPERPFDRWPTCAENWNKFRVWIDSCRAEFGDPPGTVGAPPPRPTVAAPPPPPPPPKPTEPTGPPPPPRADPPGPRPTPSAEWISGYWGWTGFEWSWVVGGYRIPDSDLRPPPAPPPPPRVEPPPPPPPARHTGYVSGKWVFTVSGWVWTPGRWRR